MYATKLLPMSGTTATTAAAAARLLVLAGLLLAPGAAMAAGDGQIVIGGQNAGPQHRGVNPGSISPNYQSTPQRYVTGPQSTPTTANPSGMVGQPSVFYPQLGNRPGVVYTRPLIVPSENSAGISTGDGFFFNGTFRSGNFRAGVHVGSTFGYVPRSYNDGCGYGGVRYLVPFGDPRSIGNRVWIPSDGGYGYGWDPSGSYIIDGYWNRPIIMIGGTLQTIDPMLAPGAVPPSPGTPASTGSPSQQQPTIVPAPTPAPASQPVPPPTPPTNEELGWEALREGRYDEAVLAWRDHLNQKKDDVPAMRAMGYALIGQRKVLEGIALISLAYETDPTLAYRSLAADFGSKKQAEDALRRIRAGILSNANAQGTSSSWLAAVTVLQAEGRIDAARRLLKKAEENGLEARIADEFRKALR